MRLDLVSADATRYSAVLRKKYKIANRRYSIPFLYIRVYYSPFKNNNLHEYISVKNVKISSQGEPVDVKNSHIFLSSNIDQTWLKYYSAG